MNWTNLRQTLYGNLVYVLTNIKYLSSFDSFISFHINAFYILRYQMYDCKLGSRRIVLVGQVRKISYPPVSGQLLHKNDHKLVQGSCLLKNLYIHVYVYGSNYCS